MQPNLLVLWSLESSQNVEGRSSVTGRAALQNDPLGFCRLWHEGVDRHEDNGPLIPLMPFIATVAERVSSATWVYGRVGPARPKFVRLLRGDALPV